MVPRDVAGLIEAAKAARADRGTAARLRRLLDLTTLNGDERPAEIGALCRDAMVAEVAAVCLYPSCLPQAKRLLEGSGVRLATVAAFPAGGDDIAKAADEARAAALAGADEVDVVAPIAAIMEGDIGAVGELVAACRAAVPAGTVLKLILETGTLERPDRITAAARAAVMEGVDFLKTSTGKAPEGATLDAAVALLAVIAEAEGQVGLKVSGGVRTADEAAAYLHLAEAVMGRDWVSPERFRIGASSLLKDLHRVEGA
ncbi:MAG: deoxyribose-phosphate aldolase [Geminicoccaceae bacterium]|nr:deoxyribose-phosphate aldolase [Geminicoccaceae bacterium]